MQLSKSQHPRNSTPFSTSTPSHKQTTANPQPQPQPQPQQTPNTNILTLPSTSTSTRTRTRTLQYHTYGPPSAFPILYIHGTPDSGIALAGFESRLASRLGLRWIAPDRPGIGDSTFDPDRTVAEYPGDIEALLGHLGVSEFAILGTSGGSPYALACARWFGGGSSSGAHKLKGVGICAGVGPVETGFEGQSVLVGSVLAAWRGYPREMRDAIDKSYVAAVRDAEGDPGRLEALWRGALETSFAVEDREVLLKGDAFRSALRALRQVYKQGSAGHAEEVSSLTRPWGFRVQDVAVEGVRLWYGGRDENTPPAMGRYMAARLPGAVYREFPGKSHYSIWCEEVVEEMVRELWGGVVEKGLWVVDGLHLRSLYE